MDFQINKRYSEHPKYMELMCLVEAGLFRGDIVEFDAVPFGSSFTTKDGAIYKKINRGSAYHKRGTNAITHGVGGIEYRQFPYRAKVRELIPVKAKPRCTESYLDFDFPLAKVSRCYKIDTKFCNLQDGDYFVARKREGVWKKIPSTVKQGRYRNAIALGSRIGLRFAKFTDDDQVKLLTEDKNYMKAEDILKDIGLADPNLDMDIHIKPQVPKEEIVANVQVSCTGFKVAYSLDDEDNHVASCSITLKIGDISSVTFKETDKVEIDVNGEKLVITPLNTLRRGFNAEIKGGSGPAIEVPILLGSSMVVAVTKIIAE